VAESQLMERNHLAGRADSKSPYDPFAVSSVSRSSESNPLGRQNAEEDIRLMAGIRAGDPQAISDMYDRYANVVYGVAIRVLQDASAAEDVLHGVFLQVWRNPDAVSPLPPVWQAGLRWLLGVVPSALGH
jgi:hypothetical protein